MYMKKQKEKQWNRASKCLILKTVLLIDCLKLVVSFLKRNFKINLKIQFFWGINLFLLFYLNKPLFKFDLFLID